MRHLEYTAGKSVRFEINCRNQVPFWGWNSVPLKSPKSAVRYPQSLHFSAILCQKRGQAARTEYLYFETPPLGRSDVVINGDQW